jgi:hypothetical protein
MFSYVGDYATYISEIYVVPSTPNMQNGRFLQNMFTELEESYHSREYSTLSTGFKN